MELKEKETNPSSTNWTAAVKRLDELYSQRIRYRDPIKESKERIKAMRTARNPDLAGMQRNYTFSENDLRTRTATKTSQQRPSTASGHVSE